MKKLFILFVMLCSCAFADSFQAIIFDSDELALVWVEELESRISSSPGWKYCDHARPTIKLIDGRNALVVAPSITKYLTEAEKSIVIDIDSSLIATSSAPFPGAE